MRFNKLSEFFSELEKNTARLKITEILVDLFRAADPEEMDKICYLSLGRLAPAYEGIEFNLAEKLMIRVLEQVYGVERKEIRRGYKELGDLGDLAYKFQISTRSASRRTVDRYQRLTVGQVYDFLLEIAREGGEGSVERKIGKMAELLRKLEPLGAKYVVRVPMGRLRLGFSELTILDALSWMEAGNKSKREEIENAYNVQADVGHIARIIREKGIKGLSGVKVVLGTPVMPALCQRLPTVEEMIEKMVPRQARGEAMVAAEPKYDGTRLQIHFSRSEKWKDEEDQLKFGFKPEGFIRTFTRNLENTTQMFPDLAEAIFREAKAKEAILDCEAISFDPSSGKFLPFQETIKRKRKHQIGLKAKEIPLKFFCFDVLYKDGKDLLNLPFSQRRKILENILSSSNKMILLSPQIVTDNPAELRKYHAEQIKKGLEGLVVKKWQSAYEPGRRGFNWVKFKQEKGKKGGGLADTLDCVVMGYYKGKGKRVGFGIGAFLVGIRGSETSDRFLTISKIGTGLTDEQWKQLKVQSSKFKVQSQPGQYKVDKNLAPDVWCNPHIVVEIEADNITKSPIHTAGLALRFPRLIRFRGDRLPQQATTLGETKRLYKLQG